MHSCSTTTGSIVVTAALSACLPTNAILHGKLCCHQATHHSILRHGLTYTGQQAFCCRSVKSVHVIDCASLCTLPSLRMLGLSCSRSPTAVYVRLMLQLHSLVSFHLCSCQACAVTDPSQLSICFAQCQPDALHPSISAHTGLAQLLNPYSCPCIVAHVSLMHLNGWPLAFMQNATAPPLPMAHNLLHIGVLRLQDVRLQPSPGGTAGGTAGLPHCHRHYGHTDDIMVQM